MGDYREGFQSPSATRPCFSNQLLCALPVTVNYVNFSHLICSDVKTPGLRVWKGERGGEWVGGWD